MWKVICFSGIDGSGKSLHARWVFKELKAEGIKCKYKWLRYPNFFSLIPLALFHLFNPTKTTRPISDATQFQTSTVVCTLWPLFQFVDTLLFTTRHVYLPALFGYTLILDRFVVDTLVDIAFSLRSKKLISSKMGKLFIRIIPKNSLVLNFDVEESLALSRKKDISEIDSLAIRRKFYKLMSKTFLLKVISTDKSFLEVHSEVMNFVRSHMQLKRRDTNV